MERSKQSVWTAEGQRSELSSPLGALKSPQELTLFNLPLTTATSPHLPINFCSASSCFLSLSFNLCSRESFSRLIVSNSLLTASVSPVGGAGAGE